MKKLMFTLSTAFLSLGMVVQANAQYPNVGSDPAPTSDSGTTVSSAVNINISGTVVIGKNFVVQPGRYVDFRLGTPYSLDPASKIAISILAANQNLAGTFIVPYFAAPGAVYTAVDVIDCSQFNFYNQGGDDVPAYGTHLVIRIYNLGDRPVDYTQLMVHWAAY